jgi:hypothetical protein
MISKSQHIPLKPIFDRLIKDPGGAPLLLPDVLIFTV